ncbi:pseudoazurin [Rhodoligotrophos defluvii]|uniref:pseudoazurin n=1 Tax=Rhodoligotrophos defluvii TaxID=2561934 RepID=UPI0010CA0539|nr:pseudoazurin [Rhodoligotrophos defluvii]
MKKLVQMAAAVASASISLMVPAHASEVSVELLNKAGERRFVFSPELLRINPGDTVVFVPTDKGHNTVSIDGMLPEGAERINIGFNKEGAVTLNRPGIYGIECTPHAGLGMVGLIVVGDPGSSDAARRAATKLPPKARERIDALLDQAES